MKNLDTLLQFEIYEYQSEAWGFSFHNFEVITRVDAPQQSNTSECGVFVANFMEEPNLAEISPTLYFRWAKLINCWEMIEIDINKVWWKLQSHDERAWLTLKIVSTDVNKVLRTLKETTLLNFWKTRKSNNCNIPVKRKFSNVYSR